MSVTVSDGLFHTSRFQNQLLFAGLSVTIDDFGQTIAFSSVAPLSVHVYQKTSTGWDKDPHQITSASRESGIGAPGFWRGSLGLSGDGNTLVVGGRIFKSGGFNSQIQVFRRQHGVWESQPDILLNPYDYGYFGAGIAVNDHGSILTVTSPVKSANRYSIGAENHVFVYRLIQGQWMLEVDLDDRDEYVANWSHAYHAPIALDDKGFNIAFSRGAFWAIADVADGMAFGGVDVVAFDPLNTVYTDKLTVMTDQGEAFYCYDSF